MKSFSRQAVIQPILIMIFFSIVLGSSTDGPANNVEDTEDEVYEESEGLFATQLHNNYLDSVAKILEFFQSTRSDLAKINSRLENLEQIAQTCQNDISGLTSQNKMLKNNIKFIRNPDVFLSQLPQPVDGKSLNGSSFKQITAALSKRWSIAVEIQNYLDADLTDYQFHRYGGVELAKAPATISTKTREVATFKADGFTPRGKILYRIGGLNLSLRLYFTCGYTDNYRRFGAALLPNESPFPTNYTCITYSGGIGTIGAQKCIYQVPLDNSVALTVNEGDIFAKVVFTHSNSTSTLSAQIFKLVL